MMRFQKKVLGGVLGAALYGLSAVTPVQSTDTITVTLKNFVKVDQGIVYNITEEGIPASEHVLIVKNPKYCDDAYDSQGNDYYFYMVDKPAGLKALITEADLQPVENLEEDIKEFTDLVKEEIENDGGVEKIIKTYKESKYYLDSSHECPSSCL